jgi:hypothetical protein
MYTGIAPQSHMEWLVRNGPLAILQSWHLRPTR